MKVGSLRRSSPRPSDCPASLTGASQKPQPWMLPVAVVLNGTWTPNWPAVPVGEQGLLKVHNISGGAWSPFTFNSCEFANLSIAKSLVSFCWCELSNQNQGSVFSKADNLFAFPGFSVQIAGLIFFVCKLQAEAFTGCNMRAVSEKSKIPNRLRQSRVVSIREVSEFWPSTVAMQVKEVRSNARPPARVTA